jgi:hypothetical protein
VDNLCESRFETHLKQAVCLVEHNILHGSEVKVHFYREVQESSRGGNDTEKKGKKKSLDQLDRWHIQRQTCIHVGVARNHFELLLHALASDHQAPTETLTPISAFILVPDLIASMLAPIIPPTAYKLLADSKDLEGKFPSG